MKRIEFVLCLFFISTVSFAQKEIAPTKNLDAYIGTWMYQSNDTIFKIVLKKGYAEDQHMIINPTAHVINHAGSFAFLFMHHFLQKGLRMVFP